MNKYEHHSRICSKLNDIYVRKNKDYGDSFAIVRKNLPNSVLVRLWDKLLRLNNLMQNNDNHLVDESIEDTLIDMANYCIMELVERAVEVEREVNEHECNNGGSSAL